MRRNPGKDIHEIRIQSGEDDLGFRITETRVVFEQFGTIGSEHPAENQWMRELADRGMLGVLALALLVGGMIRLTFQGADAARSCGWRRDLLVAVGAAYVGWAVAFLTGDHLMYDNVAGMFWYTTALTLAALRHDGQPAS